MKIDEVEEIEITKLLEIVLSHPEKTPELPCLAKMLVSQRPPMLVVHRLLERDRDDNRSVLEGIAPVDGIFNPTGERLIPEYFMELMAQSMAAVNGFDAMVDGEERGNGFIVGMNDFCWHEQMVIPGNFRIEVSKTFEIGKVTEMHGKVFGSSGELIASGEIRAWEE